MSSFQAMTPERITGVVAKFAGLRWSWSVAELDGMLAGLGWRVVGSLDEYGGVLDVGHDSASGSALVRFREGTVTEVRLPLTTGGEDSPDGTPGRRDALATTFRVATEAIGETWDRRPGKRPEVRWQVPSGTLQAIDNGDLVELNLLSDEEAERLGPSTAELLDNDYAEDDYDEDDD